ncbi:redoxin domain-containing protein [Paenibacillus aurantiacus]|uniref:Redoxin domain-containing protein n=1 Tax=Paenibacillus aurantiacus TaxID=1936118 RepID=A0ABV5KTY7_9BACL
MHKAVIQARKCASHELIDKSCYKMALLVVLAGAAIYAVVRSANAKTATIMEGRTAPDITVTDLQGRVVSLSDYRGKPLLFNFWGTWFEPCVREIPLFDRSTSGERCGSSGLTSDNPEER